PVPALQAPLSAAPAAPPAPVAPVLTAPVHGGPSHVPDQVTAQVFPEIGRLALRASSAGEGVHRITLNLHPETLGDVRVTLVVRGGEMKVSIHAATEAGRIMADSLPELRRLLTAAGAGDASLAVRDTTAGGATMSSADPGSDRSGPGRSGYDAQQGRQHGQDARMRDGHHATDGSTSGPRGALPGPHDPVRTARPAGVDVTV
ncbi:flagellar hook-length control protein FliK, partial [uncultured Nocardioides sp.]